MSIMLFFNRKPELLCRKQAKQTSANTTAHKQAITQAVTPPVVQLCKPQVSTGIVRRGTGADDEGSSVVRILHGGPVRAGLSTRS